MFTPLNVKTVYSFLSSAISLDAYIERAYKLGYQTIGIDDEKNLHAVYPFLKKVEKKGLKGIISYQADFLIQDRPVKVSFVAKNTQGYKNLLKLSTAYNNAQRELKEFFPYLSNLALVFPSFMKKDDLVDFSVFDLYAGLDMKKGSVISDLPILAFPSIRYLSPADSEVLSVLSSIKEGTSLNENLTVDKTKYLHDPKYYEEFYKENHPQALENLDKLVANIDYELEENLSLPRFNKKIPAVEELRKLSYEGLASRVELTKNYRERLDLELSVIHDMGFDDYFLIVADLLAYASSQNIYTGMGRGSAAGSLVAYALKITHVDPVANNLLFERFLNPERFSMPDIDIDIPNDKRKDLLTYVRNRYGHTHAAQILTYSTFGAKQSLRDVAKVYGFTELEATNISKLINGRKSLNQEYQENNRFRAEILKNDDLRKIYDMAVKIEGFPRQTSIHASGVVLAEDELTNYTPMAPGESLDLTQYEAHAIEDIGLLKIDFLGLRNLSLLEKMRDLVLTNHGKSIDFLKINLEDQKVLEVFRQGNTLGIFQFENPQMMKMLRRLQPDKFDDLVDSTSIFRPGPSQYIDSFIKRRHGEEIPTYPDDSVKDILAPTYGIMIYQEQIMQVASSYAGFSLGEADLLRRAISKKNASQLEALENKFIKGSLAQGHSTDQAKDIYELIERFANYGFNRSHAYAYAALAYQIAYFKAYYPEEFYQALLADGKREIYLEDALKNGFKLQSLNINKSPYYDKVSKGNIYLGLKNIKGLPRDLALWIINERPFKDLADFLQKLPENFQKVNFIAPLIQVGAFDYFDSNRRKLLENLPRLIEYTQTIQLDLFDINSLSFSYKDYDDFTAGEKYSLEKSLLGTAISSHPLTKLRKKYAYPSLADIEEGEQTILVELKGIRLHKTKNGDQMAFLTVHDAQEDFDVTLFPETYFKYRAQLEVGATYLIKGKVSSRQDRLQMIAERLVKKTDNEKKLWINLADSSNNFQIAKILKEFPGFTPVILHFENNKETRQIEIFVEENDYLQKRLKPLVLKTIYR